MSPAAEVPAWASGATLALALAGSALALTGSIGLVRLRTFYERVHAPTLAATLGGGLIAAAACLHASVGQGGFSVRAGLVALFLALTTPAGLILLTRAAAYRERVEGDADAPPDP